MPRLLTADDMDLLAYQAAPVTDDEFSGDEEPLAWEAEGWEEASVDQRQDVSTSIKEPPPSWLLTRHAHAAESTRETETFTR